MLALAMVLVVSASPEEGVVNRLSLARTWEVAQLFHPAVVHRDVDLDAAFVDAVRALDAAKTPDARRAAVELLLAPLKDPSTRVTTKALPAARPAKERRGDVLFVTASQLKEGPELWSDDAAATLFGDAARIVVDLRGADATNPITYLGVEAPKPWTLPPSQQLAHVGLDTSSSTHFRARLEQTFGTTFGGNAAAPRRRWAFIAEPGDVLPEWALALRAQCLALFVSSGELTEGDALPHVTIPLGEGALAHVRVAGFVGATSLVATDVRVPAGKDALELAKHALTSNTVVKKRATKALAPEPLREFKLPTVTAGLPDREHRLLAALRLWLVARRFWAYPNLHSVDLDELLLSLMQKLETTDTLIAYRDALAEAAVTMLPDSHTSVWSKAVDEAQVGAPFRAAFIEGQPVVTHRTPNAGHVRRGDVLLELDGQPLTALLTSQLALTPGSRMESRRHRALDGVTTLSPGAHLVTVQHADGKREAGHVTWSNDDEALLYAPVPKPHFSVLEGNIGFIDLVNLEADEVDAAMTAVKDTKALLFDIRGYPKGTAFELGPRLGEKRDIPGVASMCLTVARATDEAGDRKCEAFMQRLTPWKGERYTKPVAALIDLEAISQAEHSCLIFEAYTNVTFVGSPTRGANGNVARVALPGALQLTYTALTVAHADGRQLQNVGVVPQVPVSPTLAGFRAGRDEVLEKALGLLRR